MKAIVAVTDDYGIGFENSIPWHSADDFKHFKEVTLGSLVFMGRKTYESIGKSLPNRLNVVLTSNKNLKKYSESDVLVHSFDELLNYVSNYDGESFCIGGEDLYQNFMGYFTEIFVTTVSKIDKTPIECDAFFPKIAQQFYDEIDNIRPINIVDGFKTKYFCFKRKEIPLSKDFVPHLKNFGDVDLKAFGHDLKFIYDADNGIVEINLDFCILGNENEFPRDSFITMYACINKIDENLYFSNDMVEDDDVICSMVTINNYTKTLTTKIPFAFFEGFYTSQIIRLINGSLKMQENYFMDLLLNKKS